MSTPAGWYDDGSGAQRYWDGDAWTGHVAHPVHAAPGFAAPPNPYVGAPQYPGSPVPVGPPRKSQVGLFVGIGVAVFVLIAGLTAAAVPIFLQQREAASPEGRFDAIVEAWRAKDCFAEYRLSFASTTETTQAEFCRDVDYAWVDTYQDWEIDVTNVDQTLGVATVTTSETYTDGETGDMGSEKWTYTFDRVDGKWYYVTSELVE